MSKATEKLFQILTDAGIAATHPSRLARVMRVAPTTGNDVNVIAEELLPVACVRLDDARFEFGSSFIGENAKKELMNLEQLRRDIPGMPITIFGHADPSGQDDFNKQLSGRRAQAMYGLLTRKTKLWDDLFLHPFGEDDWKWKAIQHMLTTLGFYKGPIHGQLDGPTRQAISDFGDSPDGAGSKPDAAPFNKTRPLIYLAYMNRICVDAKGIKFQLDPVADFLAHEADKQLGRGDFQGCSEFNPSKVFSIAQDADFKKSADKTKRNEENLPNRRVVIYLFPPGRSVDLARWPCPAAKQGFAACKEQFFKSDPKGDVRRNPQTNAREYKDTLDTFACKFYDRFAVESPCERGGLKVQTQLVRVHLRLVYLDPEGNRIPFPEKFPVIVEFVPGSARNAAQELAADGRLTFNADRRKLAFRLVFTAASATHMSHPTASTKTFTGERLLTTVTDRDQAMADNCRLIRLPEVEWSTESSEWLRGTNRVTQFPELATAGTSLGTEDAPIEIALKPRWQFLRFVYFDRTLKKQLSVLPLLVEGHRDLKNANDPADAGANWTVDKPNVCQCLPWIVQNPPKPDKEILLEFVTPKETFIETAADGSRKIFTGFRSDANADRLRFYDLPERWRSRNYFARRANGGGAFFETVADQGVSAADPLIFSLDDIILVDENRNPVGWKNGDPVAVFDNGLRLFEPDSANEFSFLTKQQPLPSGTTARNYLTRYPDWVRLVVAEGNVHSAFETRTDKGDVLGARAAERAVATGSSTIFQGIFFSFTPGFTQSQHEASGEGAVGKTDLCQVRCCDVEGTTELAFVFQYLRFDFVHKALTDAGKIRKFNNDVVRKVEDAWNDGNKVVLVAQTPSDSVPKFRYRLFCQVVPAAIGHQHVNVFDRKNARANSLNWDLKDLDTKDGACTAIHETGHHISLGDEYLEENSCSLDVPGFLDNKLGLPFLLDLKAMMVSNIDIRPRYYWHLAEVLFHDLQPPRTKRFKIQRGSDTPYLIPHSPGAVDQNFVNVPLKQQINATNNGNGMFDLFLYPLGHEEYSDSVLKSGKQFDAILCIKVKMRFFFLRTDGFMNSFLTDAHQEIRKKFRELPFKIKGKDFSSCFIFISPRYLVDNPPEGNDEYLQKQLLDARRDHPGLTSDRDLWAARVNDIIKLENNNWHYTVLIHDDPFFKPSRKFWQGGSPSFNRTLRYEYSDEDDFWEFFAEMLGLKNRETPTMANFANIARFVDGGTCVPL